MVQSKPLSSLLTEDDLPETDNQPVDNELQVLIPILLRAILALFWADRTDWFMGVNLGVYYDPDKPAIGPDGFLSLGVDRFRATGKLRLSYVVWQERNQAPLWVLEVVSKAPGQEYGSKMSLYAEMGVLFYTIYNPDYSRRDKHDRFEVYRLENGVYVRQPGNPVWMPEIGLGIGYEVGEHEGLTRDWLYWYDQDGHRHPAPDNVITQERLLRKATEQQLAQERQLRLQTKQQLEQTEQQLEQERQLRKNLLEQLRQRGIDVSDL